MKILLAKPANRPLNREEAWGCVIENQLMWPGLGTWVAGRKKPGAAQMALSLVGAILFTIGMVWFTWRRLNDFDRPPDWFGTEAKTAWCGLACLGLAWLWALADSVSVVRATVPDDP